jgi:hypothetical protein
VTIKITLKVCLATAIFLGSNAFADPLSWQYLDLRYVQPSDDSTRGFSAEVSGHISKNWILQARANRLQLKESALDLEVSQSRFDIAAGRLFSFGDRFSALVSAGYTHLEYSTEIGTFDEDASDDAANVQVALRAAITDWFIAEGGLGMLFDDKDTSDLLWNLGLRFRASESVSFLIGANGIDSSFAGDDILYEIGFRFDL